MHEGFTSQEVTLLTGASYRQLDYWVTNDLITPSVYAAKGSGTQRRFSARDVFSVRVVARLMGAGMGRDAVAAAMAQIDQRDVDALRAEPILIVDGSEVFLKDNNLAAVHVWTSDSFLGVLNLTTLLEVT